MNKFWELYEKNAIISGALALIFAGGVVYLACTSQPIPEVLAGLAGTAAGYFFGAGKAKEAVQVIRGV